MRVIYRKNLMQQMDDEIEKANKLKLTIKEFILTGMCDKPRRSGRGRIARF